MDFQQIATTETSALAGRLLRKQADASLRQLQALHAALDDVARAIAGETGADDEVRDVSGRLAAALEAGRQQVRDEAAGSIHALREELAAERTRQTDLTSALAEAHEENARLRAELAAAGDEVARTRHEAEALTARLQSREEEHRAAIVSLEQLVHQADRERAEQTAALRAVSERAAAVEAEAAAALTASAARDEERCAAIAALETALADALRDSAERQDQLRAACARADAAEAEAAAATRRQDEHSAALGTLHGALDEARGEAARLAADLQASGARAEAAQMEAAAREAAAIARADEHRATVDALEAALADARRDADGLAADLQTACARTEAVDRDLAASIRAHAAIAAALDESQARAAESACHRAVLEAELAECRAALDRAGRDAGQHRTELAQATATIADLDRRLADAVAAGGEHEMLAAELNARAARIETLEAALEGHRAHVRGLEGRLHDASVAEAQLIEDFAARELALEHERTAAHAARDELTDMAAQRAAAAARVSALEEELAGTRAACVEHERLAASATAGLLRLQGVEHELTRAAAISRDEREAVAAQLQAALTRVQTLEHELTGVEQLARHERDTAAAQLEAALTRVETLEHELTGADQLARHERDAVAAQLEAALARVETLERECATLREDRAAVDHLRRDADRLVALLDLSARGAREMAEASTSTDLLGGLVKRLSLQFSRVALFRLKGDRLEVEQEIGFEDAGQLPPRMALAQDSLLGRAARAGHTEHLSGADVAARTGLAFGGAPTSAVSLPILLHGTTIGVVYADDAGASGMEWAEAAAVHESSVAFADLLVSQVAALLVRHTQELKTLAELRQYAATLLGEAREMYQADVDSGRTGDQLLGRLKENIDCASQLYAYRAAMEGTAAAALFDDQIAESVEGDSPFARDLGQVMMQMEGLESLISPL